MIADTAAAEPYRIVVKDMGDAGNEAHAETGEVKTLLCARSPLDRVVYPGVFFFDGVHTEKPVLQMPLVLRQGQHR